MLCVKGCSFSDHNSICTDALIQLKNSVKADLFAITNYINDFEDEVQRQNDKIQSLSKLSRNKKSPKVSKMKRLRSSKRKSNACHHHHHQSLRKQLMISDLKLPRFPRVQPQVAYSEGTLFLLLLVNLLLTRMR